MDQAGGGEEGGGEVGGVGDRKRGRRRRCGGVMDAGSGGKGVYGVAFGPARGCLFLPGGLPTFPGAFASLLFISAVVSERWLTRLTPADSAISLISAEPPAKIFVISIQKCDITKAS